MCQADPGVRRLPKSFTVRSPVFHGVRHASKLEVHVIWAWVLDLLGIEKAGYATHVGIP